MSEFTAVAAAQRQRLLLAEQQRLDQLRADMVRRRQDSFNNAQRRKQIVAERVELDARRIRDRRNDIEFEVEAQLSFDEQQRVLDTIDNDTLFQRNQSAIEDELNTSRDRREAAEARLLRDLETARNDAVERNELAQRAEDQRQAEINRENRIIERRIAKRKADLQAQIDLRVSLDRIGNTIGSPLRPQDALPGDLLDVRA
ncbi:MAG: hypothetical protein CMF67_01170 [Magnetovibrio sp.]|nr:hypothetical protein [Magnetovibrio sp.]